MIKNLILSGGAFRCVSHIGCVRYLEEVDALKHIDTFIGTSAGSIVACFLCLGFSSSEMLDAINEFLKMQTECPPDIDNILNIYYSMGISDGEIIKKFIRRMVCRKLKGRREDDPITFIEFVKATGKNLVVYASKLPTLDKHFFSVDTTPDLDIALAIRASCSVPIVFTPVRIGNDVFIDSGIVNNFPHDYVANNKLKDTLGLHIKGGKQLQELPQNMNLLSLTRTIMDSMMRRLNNSFGAAPESVWVINIEQTDMDGLDIHFDMSTCRFKISKSKINDLLDFGYKTIQSEMRSRTQAPTS